MTAIETLKLYEKELSIERLSKDDILRLGWLDNQRPSNFRWDL